MGMLSSAYHHARLVLCFAHIRDVRHSYKDEHRFTAAEHFLEGRDWDHHSGILILSEECSVFFQDADYAKMFSIQRDRLSNWIQAGKKVDCDLVSDHRRCSTVVHFRVGKETTVYDFPVADLGVIRGHAEHSRIFNRLASCRNVDQGAI